MSAIKEFYHEEICNGMMFPDDTDYQYQQTQEKNLEEEFFQHLIATHDASVNDPMVQEMPAWVREMFNF